MSSKNLSRAAKVTRVMNAVAAGTSDQNSSSVDMTGFEGCQFVLMFGAITATQLRLSAANSTGRPLPKELFRPVHRVSASGWEPAPLGVLLRLGHRVAGSSASVSVWMGGGRRKCRAYLTVYPTLAGLVELKP